MISDLEKYMDYDVNALLNYEYAITLKEIFEGFEDDGIIQQLGKKIESDPRFIAISSIRPETTYYISKRVLNSWFSGMIGKLIEANRNNLNVNELTKYLNSLFPYNKLNILPNEIVDYGSSYGLIGIAYTPDTYVFPISHILSFVSDGIKKQALKLINKLSEIAYSNTSLSELFTNSINKLFSDLNEKRKYILFSRIGLNTKIVTLEEIGKNLRLTRERVRQIEETCWSDLQKSGNTKFVASALIADIMIRRGSLITNDNNEHNSLRLFLAELTKTPYVPLPFPGMILLGAQEAPSLKLMYPFEKTILLDEVVNLLKPVYPFLLKSDLVYVASKMLEIKWHKMTKAQKVYMALKEIGRPAHFSEVAQVYQTLFPDDENSEHSIHAILGCEKLGLVWIGLKGTYALKEWGCERPNKTIFESVFEIVKKVYDSTSQPVSFNVIQAEIGKYRDFIKLPSLTIATYCNPKLKRVHKDSFIPNDSVDNDNVDISALELDKKLQEFKYL